MLKLEILDKEGRCKWGKNEYEEEKRPMVSSGVAYCYLATQALLYENGDQIRVTSDKPDTYLAVKLDETLDTSLVYLKDGEWIYRLDLTENAGEARVDHAFTQKRHYVQVRLATEAEIKSYRNWALNPHDQKDFQGAYPHAHANVETRNDATFFACNAINGIFANQSHGSYPYQSWGINQQQDAELTIDFGRFVCLDQAVLTLRADYPHDSHWETVTLSFSDGTEEILTTQAVEERQTFSFAARVVTSVTLKQLIKAADASPFPALTELELYGTNHLKREIAL